MRSLPVTTVLSWCVLSLAGAGAFMLPSTLPQSAIALPRPPGNVVRLTGKLWDMRATHPDM